MRFPVVLLAVVFSASPLLAQEPLRPDSARRDSLGVTRLPELNVTVTRTTEPLSRVPFATGVIERDDLRRGQQTLGLDER